MYRQSFLGKVLAAIITSAGLAAAGAGHAAEYPNKPVTIVVPFAPGGPTDASARIIAGELAKRVGGTFLVENVGGAGGTLGTAKVAAAKGDGYTLLWGGTSSLTTAPHLYKKLAYDSLKSFAPIAMAVSTPMSLAVNPTVLANTIQEFVAQAKSRSNPLNYGSAGQGSSGHLIGEMFKDAAKADAIHVPYRGGGPAMADLMGGQIQFMFDTPAVFLPAVQSGRVKVLALTGLKRHKSMPNVPTLAETIAPGFDATVWFGLVAPTGTDPEIVTRLNKAVNAALASPEVIASLAKSGFDPMPMSPEMFSQQIQSDLQKWGKVVKTGGIQIE